MIFALRTKMKKGLLHMHEGERAQQPLFGLNLFARIFRHAFAKKMLAGSVSFFKIFLIILLQQLFGSSRPGDLSVYKE